jgi:hypothetical protein
MSPATPLISNRRALPVALVDPAVPKVANAATVAQPIACRFLMPNLKEMSDVMKAFAFHISHRRH